MDERSRRVRRESEGGWGGVKMTIGGGFYFQRSGLARANPETKFTAERFRAARLNRC